MKYCTDNAAMIGAAGYYAYKIGRRAGLDLNANVNQLIKLGLIGYSTLSDKLKQRNTIYKIILLLYIML